MNENKFKYDFFICSSGSDHEFIQLVLEELKFFRIFYPSRDILKESGEMYFDVLADAMANSRNFIMIVSQESVKSKWVKIEYQTFFNNFYSEDNSRKIYLLKGKGFDHEQIPLFLRNIQVSDHISQIIEKTQQIPDNTKSDAFSETKTKKHQSKLISSDKKNRRRRKTLIFISIFASLVLLGFLIPNQYREQFLCFIDKQYQQVMFKDSTALAEEYFSDTIVDTAKYPNDSFSSGKEKKRGLEHLSISQSTDNKSLSGTDILPDIKLQGTDQIDLNNINNQIINSGEKPDIEQRKLIEGLTEARTINFPNGNKYEGELQDGILHGKGVYHFAVRCLISKNDPLERYAEPGYYMIGEWFNGELYMGRLFNSKGELKDRIIIGRK